MSLGPTWDQAIYKVLLAPRHYIIDEAWSHMGSGNLQSLANTPAFQPRLPVKNRQYICQRPDWQEELNGILKEILESKKQTNKNE